MKREWIASNIFNLAFFSITSVMCFAYIPLLLLPRPIFVKAVIFWVSTVTFLEKNILGLTYEVRGAENLPKFGSYLVAAKHQSAYETFKLYKLFDNPAIILKKELLNIPIWGMYLRKSDVIAIDRSTPTKAMKSIDDGVMRMAEQGRPIVIFPQGTRVKPEHTTMDKPYKPGIARMQELTGLPIIPMALNSGMFCPRNGWLKSSGTVIFEFLKPIEATGKNRKELMKEIEEKIENTSSNLMSEAQIAAAEGKRNKKPGLIILAITALLFGAYSILWFKTAEAVEALYIKNVQKAAQIEPAGIPIISGFPGKIKLDVFEQSFYTDKGSLKVQILHAEGWPLPVLPVKITTGPITIQHIKWKSPLTFETASADINYSNNILNILDSSINQGKFIAALTGSIDFSQPEIPELDLQIALKNHNDLLLTLTKSKIMEGRSALFTGAGLMALSDPDGIVRVPLTQRDRVLYAGPLPVAYLPE